jgi:hypothetical protein
VALPYFRSRVDELTARSTVGHSTHNPDPEAPLLFAVLWKLVNLAVALFASRFQVDDPCSASVLVCKRYNFTRHLHIPKETMNAICN